MRRHAERFVLLCALLVGAPGAAVAFEGRYLVGDEDYHQFLDVTKTPDGRYAAKFDVSNQGCEGALEGRGVVAGGVLVIRPVKPYGASDKCVVKLRQSGGSLTVTEKGCLAWRGVACEFAGEYDSRRTPAK